jgi:Uma2 family endonuclease
MEGEAPGPVDGEDPVRAHRVEVEVELAAAPEPLEHGDGAALASPDPEQPAGLVSLESPERALRVARERPVPRLALGQEGLEVVPDVAGWRAAPPESGEGVVDEPTATSDNLGVEAGAERVSVETYLEMDATADGKLELLNGVVLAMAGASPRHNQIVQNLARALGNGLDGSDCRVWTQDQRVRVEVTDSYLYPDAVVVCGEPRFDTETRPASLINPTALVEVLSESTHLHDLGAKLSHYRQIPSVAEVLFVHAETRATTLVTRQDDGSWKLVDRGPEGELELAGVRLPLDVIYERTDDLPA